MGSHHQHDHSDEGHIHHHGDIMAQSESTLIFVMVLNVVFVIVEVIFGLTYNSLALLSDASHNLGDIAGLLLAFIAIRLAKLAPTNRYTYGYSKGTILASLFNSLILLIAVTSIIYESIRRIAHPEVVDGGVVAIVAGIGIVINGLSAWLLFREQHDINMKAAYLHMLADTLISLGVVITGLLIKFYPIPHIDPIVSIIIGAIILVSSIRLLRQSLRMTLDGVPQGIKVDEIENLSGSDNRVADIHHIHIWPLSSTRNALTAHVVVKEGVVIDELEEIKLQLKERLAGLGIDHATLEMEYEGKSDCEDC